MNLKLIVKASRVCDDVLRVPVELLQELYRRARIWGLKFMDLQICSSGQAFEASLPSCE